MTDPKDVLAPCFLCGSTVSEEENMCYGCGEVICPECDTNLGLGPVHDPDEHNLPPEDEE